MTIKQWRGLRFILTLAFIILLLIIAELTGIKEEFSLENLKTVFQQQMGLAIIVFFLLFSFGNLIFIPGWVFLAASILVLGYLPGYFLTLAAALFSCTFSFFLIRLIGADSIREIPYRWVKNLLSHLDQYPIRTVIILRIVFQTGPPLNYTLAISGIKYRDYILGCLIGLPIPILFYTIFIKEFIKTIN